MNFLAPIFFWSFLALIPLVGIYFLKVKPTRKKTTALFLWQKIFFEKQTNSLFQRLRNLWSLLLMVVAFSLAIFALTRPEFSFVEKKDLIILIDESASMSTLEGTYSRLELAKREAKKIVRAVDGSQKIGIFSIASEIKHRTYLTYHTRELVEAIDLIEGTDMPLVAKSLDSLFQLKGVSEDYQVLLISDGASINEAWVKDENISLVLIGESQQNIGLIAADFRSVPGLGRRAGFYFQIASTYQEKTSVDLELKHEDTDVLIKIIPLEIRPGINEPEVYFLDNPATGKWSARLRVDDAFQKDDLVHFVLPELEPVKISVQAEDPYFYKHSVFAFSGESGLLELVNGGEDLVVSHRRSVDAEAVLFFEPLGESAWWHSLGKEIDSVSPRVVIKDHPVIEHLELTQMTFLGARELNAPDEAIVLVENEDAIPLIYEVRKGNQRAVVVNMDPSGTDFYFSAWFPILVYNSALFLAGREQDFKATYPTGTFVDLPGKESQEEFLLQLPTGEQTSLVNREYGPLKNLGYYSMKNDEGAWEFSSSLLSEEDSLLESRLLAERIDVIPRGRSIAYLLTILAIIFLVAESILYDRRLVG
ncbi:MAG: BatA and WFA domain-containing protein [Verrucomicrobiota bacterium]